MKKAFKITAWIMAGLITVCFIGAFALVPELPGYLVYKARSVINEPVPPERDLTRIEAYNFVPGSRLEDRVSVIPPALLALFRDLDKAPEYEAYEPKAADKALFMEYFSLLPPVYKQVFYKRCVGIFFVKNLKGNGVTSWAEDAGHEVYFHIVLNPAALTDGLSATLSAREKSCFVNEAGAELKVDAGKKYKGLLYGLFHEATHGVDYVKGITPYADDTMPVSLRPEKGRGENFFRASWADFALPVISADYPLRDKITFYGLNGGPKLRLAEAPGLYAGMERGGFVSLYGSRSWAEDCAELATMYMLNRRLGQPYKIKLKAGGTPLIIEPLRSGLAAARAEKLMQLLNETEK